MAYSLHESYSSYKLPNIDFSDIISIDKSISIDIVTKLVTIGIIEVKNIPNFKLIKKLALENVAECLTNEEERTIMKDGSYRKSMMAVSKNNVHTKFNSKCGDNAEKLRNTVDIITNSFIRGLDIYNDDEINQIVMKPNYMTFNDIIFNGEHLEHIHAYYGIANGTIGKTIDVHIDSGLMIAMTSGYYNNNEPEGSGLFIELPLTGMLVHAEIADDSVVIMMGEGIRWLTHALGTAIRSVPHALVANLRSSDTRGWYGKMYLPPPDALIYDQMTYQEFKEKQIAQVRSNKMTLPVACHNDRLLASTVCPPGSVHCWMHCMSSANLTCGDAALCWDTYSDKQMNGDKMCSPSTACHLQCPIVKNVSTTSNWDGYCYGSGTTMIMEGMKSVIFNKGSDIACTNILFEHLTLNNSYKFGAACVLILIVCIFSQYLTSYRLKLSAESNDGSRYKYWRKIFLYFIHMNLGYLIMLIGMTYVIELFLMVTMGLTVGFAIFNMKETALVNNGAECCTVEMSDINQNQYDILIEKENTAN